MMEEQLSSFLLTNSGGGRNKYCIFCEFIYCYENIVETIRQGKFGNKIHGNDFEWLTRNGNWLQQSDWSMALWLGFLTDITSGNIPLDISGHPRPIISRSNTIVSFCVSSVCRFSQNIMDFTHYRHSEG